MSQRMGGWVYVVKGLDLGGCMKVLIGKALQGMAILWGACLGVAWFMVASVESIDPKTGIHRDGLGRVLSDAPGGMGALGQVGTPGSVWSVIDLVVFFGSLAIIGALFKMGSRMKASV